MARLLAAAWLALNFQIHLSSALKYDPLLEDYNLNQNKDANSPFEYDGKWKDHQFHPSPTNWRFPFYTLFLDRYVNGDPTNDNANGTRLEHDYTSTQFRHGGDLKGLVDSLDYIQGMGVKGIYIAGSPFINSPWGVDSYSVSLSRGG
jgi:alpha-1,3-glucan synthase